MKKTVQGHGWVGKESSGRVYCLFELGITNAGKRCFIPLHLVLKDFWQVLLSDFQRALPGLLWVSSAVCEEVGKRVALLV